MITAGTRRQRQSDLAYDASAARLAGRLGRPSWLGDWLAGWLGSLGDSGLAGAPR